jgi:glucokinase
VLDDCLRLAKELMSDATGAGWNVGGIGVGLCELIAPGGRILSSSTVDWSGLALQDRLSTLAPFTLEADVRAAALAEAAFGAGRGLKVFLYVTVGTGISCCLMIDGKPLVGAHGASGTMASAPLRGTCERCGWVNEKTLEQIAAGPALAAAFEQLGGASAKGAHEIIAAATQGDTKALSVARFGGEALGIAIGGLVNVLDPQAVIIGGGLGSSHGPYWESLVTAARRQIWSDVNREVPFLQATTGSDAGFIGAATAVWHRQRQTIG